MRLFQTEFLPVGNLKEKMKIKIGKYISIWKCNPHVISPGPCWCCTYYYHGDCYLHVNESVVFLLWEVVTEHCNDRHLVGYGFDRVYGK